LPKEIDTFRNKEFLEDFKIWIIENTEKIENNNEKVEFILSLITDIIMK
jgi:hypothetical protein